MISVNKTPALDILRIKPCGEDEGSHDPSAAAKSISPKLSAWVQKATVVEALSGNVSNFQS
ncbi:hypothetical protein E5D57_012185 [Metarhizium anisopliae]|nr:hypothetical protein E5D57_012185 [Metarhizium anisopliae]